MESEKKKTDEKRKLVNEPDTPNKKFIEDPTAHDNATVNVDGDNNPTVYVDGDTNPTVYVDGVNKQV